MRSEQADEGLSHQRAMMIVMLMRHKLMVLMMLELESHHPQMYWWDQSQEIFSPSIVGAGSIREGEETDQLTSMALNLAQFYCLEMENPVYQRDKNLNTIEAQNKYCRNQKMNKMLHSSILAMGISEERKNQYVEEVLFEEV